MTAEEIMNDPVLYAAFLHQREGNFELHESQKEALRRLEEDNPAGTFRDDDK